MRKARSSRRFRKKPSARLYQRLNRPKEASYIFPSQARAASASRLGQAAVAVFRVERVRYTQSGMNTSATPSEASSATTTGRARRIMKKRISPSTSTAGRNTTTVVRVAVVMARPISWTPLMQASRRGRPA